MSSRPQRKAAVIAEVKMAAALVPERNSLPITPKEPMAAALVPERESLPITPKEPAKRKVAHLTQLAQVAPLDAERVRVKRVKIQLNRQRDID
jgi:hypothetical protein